MEVLEIGTMVSLGLTALSVVVSLVICLIKNKGNKLSNILVNIPKYITEAEKLLGAGTGPAKFQYVLSKIQMDCINANVKYDASKITSHIEEILGTPQASNEVSTSSNKRKDVED